MIRQISALSPSGDNISCNFVNSVLSVHSFIQPKITHWQLRNVIVQKCILKRLKLNSEILIERENFLQLHCKFIHLFK